MAEQMSFVARVGHPCGGNFNAKEFLEAHPEYSWQTPVVARHERRTVDHLPSGRTPPRNRQRPYPGEDARPFRYSFRRCKLLVTEKTFGTAVGADTRDILIALIVHHAFSVRSRSSR